MCTPVFRSLDHSTSNLKEYPLKDQVYWSYNRAILLISESNYQNAKEHLSNAIQILLPQIYPVSIAFVNSSRFRNMLKILSLLIPLEYFYSQYLFSSDLLLNLISISSITQTSISSLKILNSFISLYEIYKKLFLAIKNGSFCFFSTIIVSNETILQSKDLLQFFIFLFKPLILKNFIKKMYFFVISLFRYSITRQFDLENRLSLSYIIDGIKLSQRNLDLLDCSIKSFAWINFPFLDSSEIELEFQVESLISMLITQGFIKGYIHHEKKILVLSKINPFPHF